MLLIPLRAVKYVAALILHVIEIRRGTLAVAKAEGGIGGRHPGGEEQSE